MSTADDSSVGQEGSASEARRSCGPDSTDWFVDIMNAAKSDPRVVEIKRRVSAAEVVGGKYGYSAQAVLEGGLARKVLAAERAAGNPPRTAAATAQIAAADPQNQFGRALLVATVPLPFIGAPEHAMLAALKSASEGWKSLVQTGADLDFKNNVLKQENLTKAGCPAPTCPRTITLLGACYGSDLPGNIFYAYLSGFCGFSRTTVHLGSQFAQLQENAGKHWDPPEDTAAMDLGYDLPTALITRAVLSAALKAAASALPTMPCAVCQKLLKVDQALVRQ